MIRKLIDLSIKHRAIVLFGAALLTVWGVWSVINTPIDAIPDLSDTQVIIYSTWKGRDPETIEKQVTYPITAKMLAVPKSKVVRAFSMYSYSLIYVIFEDGTDIYWARSRVLEYLSTIAGQLPEGVTSQLGPDATGVGWIYQYTLEDTSGKYDLGELRAIQDWYVRYPLTTVPDVAEVASIGGFARQFQVIIDPAKLFSLNIPLSRVAEAIKSGNNDAGGASVEVAEREKLLKGIGYIKTLGDLENIVVEVRNGLPILVRDVSKAVVIGPEMRRGIAEKNGEGQVVGGIVVMRFGKNAREVINNVKEKISEISKGLPAGVVIKPVYDRSALINRSIKTLSDQLKEILGMMALVCIIFLFHIQSALVSWLALPIGTLIAFIIMYFLGVNSNIMSLGGIAIALGDMADGAISLVENLHKKLEKNQAGKNHWELVAEAAKEVGPGIFGSLLVLVVSFLPIFALDGQAGRLFKPLAYTKTFALAGGCLITITLIPVLMGYFVRGKIIPEKKNPVNRGLINLYLPILNFCLKYRKTVLLIAVVGLLSMYIPYQKIGSEFMPPLDEGDILYMPTSYPGISVTVAQDALQRQDQIIKMFPEVAVVFGKTGRAETATDPAPLEMVETTISLKPRDEWLARKIKEGYLLGLAEDALASSGLDEQTLKRISRETENMALFRLNKFIRLKIVSSSGQQAELERIIRDELPAKINEELINAIKENLRAENIKFDASNLKLPVSEIPMRPVASTYELMSDDMESEMKFPGFVNAWTMPIKTRIDMLSTGVKTPVAIKVFGPDINIAQEIAKEIETAVKRDPGTQSAIGERFTQGYVTFDIKREECARYGLSVGEVQDIIETAIGGMNISEIVEGPYRFSVNIRYPREMRDNIEELKRVLVSASGGQNIPLMSVADIVFKDGYSSIKTEQSIPVSVVYITLKEGQDVGSYVARVKGFLEGKIKPPAGYYYSFSGQYEYMEALNKRLLVVVPLTLVIITIIVYFTVGSILMTLILLITLPFSLIGGFWYMYIMDFNMSLAVVSGFIVLAGFASQTAIIMHVYLDLAMEEKIKSGIPITKGVINAAMIEGAVMRVRPKIMSVATSFFGLLPLLWTSAAEGGPLLRMAVPLMGGLVTSVIHTLLLIPLYYAIYLEIKYKNKERRKT
ncbi:MAG: efflux RND transporter permease subunit [Planctomycetes bacterium]|nr:efflux RND transporter permease subunit [Planctomycetota bacterium]